MTDRVSPSRLHIGWQIGLFAILLIGSFLAEMLTRLLMGLGFDSDGSGFWSAGMSASRIAEAILRLLFVALIIGLACRPMLAPGRPLITNWFSAFMLSWLAMDILGTALRLALAFVQDQMVSHCQAAGGVDCYSGIGAIRIVYGIVTIGITAVQFGLLSVLARPAESYASAGNGWVLGAIAGAVMAVIGIGISMATTSLYAGSGSMDLVTWLMPLAFNLLDAAILAITLGFWRRGYMQGGIGGIALRFD